MSEKSISKSYVVVYEKLLGNCILEAIISLRPRSGSGHHLYLVLVPPSVNQVIQSRYVGDEMATHPVMARNHGVLQERCWCHDTTYNMSSCFTTDSTTAAAVFEECLTVPHFFRQRNMFARGFSQTESETSSSLQASFSLRKRFSWEWAL